MTEHYPKPDKLTRKTHLVIMLQLLDKTHEHQSVSLSGGG